MLETNCDLFSLASCSCRLLSWISSNSRTFSMAIAAWSAKVDTSSICFSVNGRTSERVNASRDALAQHWHAEHRAVAAQPLGLCPGVVRVGQDVGDMDHPTFQQGPSSRCPASPLDGHSLDIFDELGRVTVSLREEEHSILLSSYRGVVGVTKAAS